VIFQSSQTITSTYFILFFYFPKFEKVRDVTDEPTIEHKYSLLESLASTRPRYLLAMESMQDHKQTQHVEIHNDDLDHDRQLTRSRHEAHRGEDNHLATATDP
jgi:hypothetical protein